jgi:hypothetical protein
MTDMADMEKMVEAFCRLVDRVIDGRVVPFVGAGISQEARVSGNSDFKPTVGWLQDRLGKELDLEPSLDGLLQAQIVGVLKNVDPPLRSSPWPKAPQVDSKTRESPVSDQEPKESPSKEKGPQLDCEADVMTWRFGAARLCEALNIDAFTKLTPLPAHRFLAYLAREGLITEIITTNYDTCIEQAFRNSFSSDERWEASDTRVADIPLAVIFNLSQYRTHGSRQRTRADDHVLHLYKINGDAADYVAAVEEYHRHRNAQRLEDRAARIIVTERQLQTFRDEMWARDLFSDRVRSRSLVFCGFGSEEPQVRHHAMVLMDEMQRQSEPEVSSREFGDVPNAPFWAEYRPRVSFAQLQVLMGFASAHVRPSDPRDAAPDVVLKAAFLNVLLGPFAMFLKGPTFQDEKQELEADLFFERLFHAVWLRRFAQEITIGSVLHTWLRSVVLEHRAWADWLLVGPSTEERNPGVRESAEDLPRKHAELFGDTEQMFWIDPRNPCGATRASRSTRTRITICRCARSHC